LVNQLFFAGEAHAHRRVLFAAVDDETQIGHLCERVARALSRLSASPVALVCDEPVVIASELEGPAQVSVCSAASQMDENLWRVPFEFLDEAFPAELGVEEGASAPYVVFGVSINAPAAPSFCGACDGAVLVLNANRTRREAAVRAKEILAACNVQLLGAVLNNRTFPVPEFLYRRL
jgi:hypothetical protein